MPTISPSLVPTVAPGALFDRFTTDTSINIRWFVASDPVYFETLNRPLADLALRQLIIAKTLDQLNLRLGHQALFPYITQPRLAAGTSQVDVPLSMIWDMHVSLPVKWEKVRLAKVKRISGVSTGTDPEHTGTLRLVFTAQQEDSVTEVAVFQADMDINSVLQYQVVRVEIPTTADEDVPVDAGESETIGGFIIFRTLDQTDTINDTFLTAVAPPIAGVTDSNGEYTSPAVYEVVDSTAGGTDETDDFDLEALAHGTGMLTSSAYNAMPDLNSDIQTILNTLNFPFDAEATRASASPTGITIPKALFREFNIVAPAGDEPTGDTSGNFYPVWVSRIVREDASADALTFYFSTYNVGDTPSIVPIEFAKMELSRSYDSDRVVAIEPITNLFGVSGTVETDWRQGFGKGHVVLSSLWGGTSSAVDAFFDSFIPVIDEPAEVLFSKSATRLSSFGVGRVPKTIPTDGQAQALRGSRADVSDPNSANRYVVEADQGLGDRVDFSTHTTLPADKRENQDIERYGYTGALAHRMVFLCVNTSGTSHDYNTDILPRLQILLGRNPQFGDVWYDGTRFKFCNPDGVWIG